MLVSRVLSVCLLSALAAVPLVPAEHVHQTDGPDGHHHAVAHAHLEDHHHRAVAEAEPLGTHVEDDDSVLVTFDRTFLAQSVHHVELVVAADSYLSPPAAVRAGVAARYQRRFIHGPPRAPTGLRAPPALLS